MADVSSDGGGSHKKGKGKPKGKKQSTHIDMTPMVDLAFLLLTFFMLATSFNKPKTMEIVMPDKPKDMTKVPELDSARALTILMGKGDKIFYYIGLPDKKTGVPELVRSDYSPTGIRKVLQWRNKYVANLGRLQVKDRAMFCLIKPSSDSKYKNVVDIFDEMNIVGIKFYAIVDITSSEEEALKKF